jgi:hypothetical protein
MGWIPFVSPGTSSDPKGGTAVIIRRNSLNIRISEISKNSLKKYLNGRFIAVEVTIQGEQTWLSSVYLNASPQTRKLSLDLLDQIAQENPANSIVGGDFNCVANPLLDIHRPNPRNIYSNEHSRQWEWETFAASKGSRDAYRILHKNQTGEYTRYSPNLCSRIDRTTSLTKHPHGESTISPHHTPYLAKAHPQGAPTQAALITRNTLLKKLKINKKNQKNGNSIWPVVRRKLDWRGKVSVTLMRANAHKQKKT